MVSLHASRARFTTVYKYLSVALLVLAFPFISSIRAVSGIVIHAPPVTTILPPTPRQRQRQRQPINPTDTTAPPPPHGNGDVSRNPNSCAGAATSKKSFRIRRTKATDLNDVSSMLALESVPASNNWNDGMRRLRIKAALETQLRHRLRAVEEGWRVVSNFDAAAEAAVVNVSDAVEECLLSNDDDDDRCQRMCEMLWTSELFRSKLKNAVSSTQERTVWEGHNLDMMPDNLAFLNHAMITVEDISSGDVAGFCEVALLPKPKNKSADERGPGAYKLCVVEDVALGNNCAPALVNLVISASYRRRGIASRVVNFAAKYTRTHWEGFDDLGLYVDPSNQAALKLYRREGFEPTTSRAKEDDDNGLIYLSRLHYA